MIALALACQPGLLLADEPTTALDATVQMQILLLLRQLQRENGMSVLFVTHDIGAAVEVADRIAVMYAGRIIEQGPVGRIVRAPRHPYTAGLLAATVGAQSRGKPLPAIPGAPPDLARLPAGCSFAPRCSHADARCRSDIPPLESVGDDFDRLLAPAKHNHGNGVMTAVIDSAASGRGRLAEDISRKIADEIVMGALPPGARTRRNEFGVPVQGLAHAGARGPAPACQRRADRDEAQSRSRRRRDGRRRHRPDV